MFVWSGGRRENVIFKTPNDCMLRPDEVTGFDEVWFVDLCPASLDDPAGGLPFWVCDHHVTNQKKCDGDPRCTFSMVHSGTSLLARETGYIDDDWDEDGAAYEKHDRWKSDRVTLIRALEAYDLGRFDNWKGQRMADCAGTLSQDGMLNLILNEGDGAWYNSEVAYRAMAAAGARTIYAQRAAETAFYFEFLPPGWTLASGMVDAGITVSPEPWKNACAEEILKRAELAIVVDSSTWSISFRSKTLDVSMMAQEFGGGGHKRAAGFKISSHDTLQAIVEEIFG